jgi:hypothetical protein
MRNHTGTAVLNVTSKTAKFTIGKTTHDESLCLQALTVAPGQRCGATCYPNLVGQTFDGSVEVWDMSTAQLNKAATDAAGGLPAADPLVRKTLPPSSTRNTQQRFCVGCAPSTCRRRTFFPATPSLNAPPVIICGRAISLFFCGRAISWTDGWMGTVYHRALPSRLQACRLMCTAYDTFYAHLWHAPLPSAMLKSLKSRNRRGSAPVCV